MDLPHRLASVSELKDSNRKLTYVVIALAIAVMLALVKIVTQTEIVIQRTPGMPSESRLEKTAMDKRTQLATLLAVTNALGSINPYNAEFQKELLYAYLSAQCYTRIAAEIDEQVERLKAQRELGSYYFVFGRYEYDPILDRHFIVGEHHTVNAAKDTTEDYVFEYAIHIENYRLVVDDIKSYTGKQLHNSEYYKGQKQ